MVTEDYISFEVAKLLKEKGFNEKVICYYDDGGSLNLNKFAEFQCCNEGYGSSVFAAPTLQMAMKWLREDKKILISIFCHIDKGYWFCIQNFIDSPYKFATSESIHRKEEILGKIQYYDKYEKAVEAAIKYCLENLI